VNLIKKEKKKMKEDYNRINSLKFRDRITSKDIDFTRSMHDKYCGQLKKQICWQCPNSIREAIYDLINYVEKNPLQDESKTDTSEQPSRAGEGSPEILKGSKGGKPSTGSE
jgi:hypothetical protein